MVLNQINQYKRGGRRRGRRRRPTQNGYGTIAKYAGKGMQMYNWANTAYKAYSLASKVAGLINAEMKRFTYGNHNPAPDSSASVTFYTINAIPQGTSNGQRTGDSLKIKKAEFVGHFSYNSAGGAAQIIRLIILWDRDNTVASPTDYLENTATSYAPDSNKVWDKRFDTKKLLDKRFVVSANDPVALIRSKIPVNMHTQFTAGTTAIEHGAIKVMIFSDQPIAGNPPGSNLQAFCYYVDN